MENFSEFGNEKIIIDDTWSYGCDRCIICDEHYKHSRVWWGENTHDAERGIFVLKEKIAHHECSKIMNNIRKKRAELLELEFKLFEKQFMIKPTRD